MSDKSAIEWTDATWNPTTGCDRVSPGCANCYALDLAARLKEMGQAAYQADGDPRTSGPGFALTLHEDRLDVPLRWARPRRIFVNSMSDLFHPDVPSWFVRRVWRTMAKASHHSFQVLTKRPERMRAWVAANIEVTVPIVPNVWLGTSVENARWRTRIDDLRETAAAIRFLSCEPLLGPLGDLDLGGIGWVIAGGESGPNARPVKVEWVREIRDQCADAGVPFLFKQWGGRTSKSGGRELDGRTHDAFPVPAHKLETAAAS
jgi:protein gp37